LIQHGATLLLLPLKVNLETV